nr:helix-turn-helix domain-containing protein [Mucilaginibacter sp. L294]
MEDISTYSITRLQKAFGFPTIRNNYFFVNVGKEPLFTDEPFRTETYAILFLKEGTISLQAGLMNCMVSAPAVVTIGPTITRSFERSTETPIMEIIFFTEAFLLETRSNIFYLNKYSFFEDNDLHVLQLEATDQDRLAPVFNLIRNTFDKQHVNEAVLMRSYAYLLVHEIDALHKGKRNTTQHHDDNSTLFVRFRNLLTKEFWRQRSVSFYANSLNVTPKYLSEVIKRQTGKTAGEWIDKAIILESKVLLQNKDLGIAQVSEKLHFSDQSIFGKFFKIHQGVSPLEYRKSIK